MNLRFVNMVTDEECLLKAENYAIAAQTAETAEQKRVLMRLAAIYRNKALRLKLGKEAGSYLKPNPLTSKSSTRW